MPTTLFVQQQLHLPGLGGEEDCCCDDDDHLHHLHHPTTLCIISEHDYVRSLIPSAAQQREARSKAAPSLVLARRLRAPPRRLGERTSPRPLMATLTYASEANMALDGPPGSPPDLTNSKSSKSSSLHSATLSDIIGPNDLTHFEEINLEDLQAPRTSISSSRSAPYTHPPHHSFRDLTSNSKPRFPSLKGQVNNAVRQQPSQLSAPGRQMRRGFTSPSAPSLASMQTLSAPGRRSRSPSPSNPQAVPSAPRTLSRKSSRNLDISPSPSMSVRRQSWQHSTRKSVKEREAECDDEDDELPDDAYLWGVPISPRPTQERSPAPSACNSPPQTSPSPASSRPVSRHSSAASTRPSPAVIQKGFPQQPSPDSASVENVPPSPLLRQRTNTWENTYSTLDADGKKLTEALEEYETELERQQVIKRQQTGLKRSASVEQPKSTVKLPPIRKSDPLIDPFQPSVEKQKYLSRTRPSWLPPKDPKEEKKHLREYQKMHERIEEALRLAVQKEEEEKLARETAERKKAEVWESLLPKWDTEMATQAGKATYRKLWWNGVPPKFRGPVWKKAIGNDLEMSETTFRVALKKAKAQVGELGGKALGGKLPTIVANTKDVFPDLKMFAPSSEQGDEQPYHRDLVDVCLAYASYRPDVDTLTGIHHIAGLFLLNMSATDAFICLGNLLNRPLPLSFLIRDHTAIMAAYDTTLSALSQKAPSLARHLADLRVEPRDYLGPMFSSLFCDRLSIEHAARVMDLYTIEGDKIPPRVAVAVLGILEGRLYEGGIQDLVRNLNSKDIRMSPEDFSAKVYEAGKSSETGKGS